MNERSKYAFHSTNKKSFNMETFRSFYKFFPVRRAILLALSIILLKTSNAQEPAGCLILKTILKDDLSRRTFKLDRHKDLPITFIDKKGIIGECVTGKIFERDVNIIYDSSYKRPPHSWNIIIYGLEKRHNRFKMTMEQTATGATGYIEFRRSRDKMVVTKFAIGYF
jgi:hypothetical protein